MDDEQQKDDKEQQSQNNRKEAINTGIDTAATAAGVKPVVDAVRKTPIAGQMVDKKVDDLADKLGDSKAASKIIDNAADSGAFNKAKQAMNATSGGIGGTSSTPQSNRPTEFSRKSFLNDVDDENDSSSSNENSSEDNDSDSEDDVLIDSSIKAGVKGMIPKLGIMFFPILMSFLIFIIIIVVISSKAAPISNAVDFVKGIWNSFAIGDEYSSDEEAYYAKLTEIQKKISDKYGVCVDINLITATLTAESSFDDVLTNGKETADVNESDTSQLDYNKMIKQIEILANYQIKRTNYSYPTKANECYYVEDEDKSDFCVEGGAVVKVESEGLESCGTVKDSQTNTFVKGKYKDSSTAQLVSRNDLNNGVFSFLLSAANKEKNYEYNLVYPDYTWKDTNGDGELDTKECIIPSNLDEVPPETSQNVLDIGDLNSETSNVYYWNIVENFISDYYDDYLPADSIDSEGLPTGERLKVIKEIADSIYLLWNDYGTSQFCDTSGTYCRKDSETAETYVSASRQECYDKFAQYAVDDMAKTGVLASVTLAQLCIESGNGGSNLSVKYSNYFGVTAGSSWTGATVSMCNKSGVDCQLYRVYDSLESSIADHSRLLSTSRYAVQGWTDYKKVINKIKDSGYATDENYVSTLVGQVETYNLTQYDIGEWNGASSNEVTYDYATCINSTTGAGTASSGSFTGGGVCTSTGGVSDSGNFWSSNNKFPAHQCTWYAYGRGLQILTSNGVSLSAALSSFSSINGDAQEWYQQNTSFDATNNINSPRVGSIIVWKQPGYWGHVAVVEKINYDSAGNLLSLVISEGNVKLSNGSKADCLERTVTMDYVKSHSSSSRGVNYQFVGYIHLLK